MNDLLFKLVVPVEPITELRTIRDLASHLGVSSMTVHRAIAGKPDISEKTRDRILAEVERLGWRPNLAARGLRQGKTFTLGILVSNVAASFLPEILQGVDGAAERAGCHTIVCVHEHNVDRSVQHLQNLHSKGVDGLILYPTESGGEAECLAQVAMGTPVVLIMREIPELDLPTLLVDDAAAGGVAAQHLLSLGHTRIGFIGYAASGYGELRRQGFLAALAEAGVAALPEWIAADVSTQEFGTVAARGILSGPQRPTALFCASDRLAARAVQAAGELGLRVPQDVSVMGCNGDPWSELLSPPLTTVAQPRTELGVQAAEAVLHPERVRPASRRRVLNPRLVVRKSTGPVNG